MATILAETTASAVPVKCVINKNGPVTGLSIECSVYDAVNDTWLDFDDDSFQAAPTTKTKSLVYKEKGLYYTLVNTSNASANVRSLTVIYDVTAGATDGVGEDEIVLGGQWYDISGQTELDAVETHGDSTWSTAAGFATPGEAMTLQANAVDASALATDAVTEIRNAILSDGTAFAGASIASILADTGTDMPATLAAIQGAGFVTGTDSLEAIRDQGDAAWTTGAGGSAQDTADAVWDALAASYNDPNTMGELLNGAGGAFTPAQVADAVWAEAIADHLGAGQAAQYVSDIIDDTSSLVTAVTSNLDAPISTRAVPGDGMVASSIAANAVNASALATDAVTEIAAGVGSDLSGTHGSGAWGTAVGFAVQGDAMTLTAGQEVALVDSVWDELNSGHVAPGTTGANLANAGAGSTPADIADAVWDEARAGHTTGGTFGFYLDAAVSAAGDVDAIAAAVWSEDQSTYVAPGTFGYYVDGQITDAGDPAAIADAVWDEAQAGHTTAGTFGLYLDSEVSTSGGGATPAQVADAVWDEAASGHVGAGSFGLNLGTAVSTRAAAGDEMAMTSGAESAMASAAADAVWDEAASGHTAGGSFGENLGVAVSTRAVAGDDMALTSAAESDVVDAVWDEAASGHVGAGSFGLNLDAAVSTRAVAGDEMAVTAASEGTIADAVWDETAAQHVGAGSFGENLGVAVSTRTVAGDAMTLTAGADSSVADAVWDEAYAAHTTGGSFGSRIDAAISAAGDPAAVADAVWDEAQSGHVTAGTFGANLDVAVSAAGDPAAIADAVWDEVQTGHTTAGTFGLYLDSEVSSAGGGGLTEADIADAVWDEILPINHVIADSASDIVQAALTGGVTPSLIAGAVWDALLANYTTADSMGAIMNAFKTGQLDTTTIIEAMNAGVAVVINSLSESGQYTNPLPVILDTIYTGHKGDQLLTPVYRNGQLMPDVELDGSTQLAMEINNITTGDQYDITVGVSVGPSGHILYTTREADGIFEVAGKWAYQASGLDANLVPFVSQRLTVRVYDDVA